MISARDLFQESLKLFGDILALRSLAISLAPMIQAKEVMPGFPSSPVVHLVCPTKKKLTEVFFCVPPCERKRMIIYNLQTILFWGSILAFGLVSVEGLGDGWRCLDDWLSVSLESTRWRWLFVFRLLPRKHLLQLKLKFHDLRFWKASCFGCSIHPKAHPNKCPKENREVPNRPPLVTSYESTWTVKLKAI